MRWRVPLRRSRRTADSAGSRQGVGETRDKEKEGADTFSLSPCLPSPVCSEWQEPREVPLLRDLLESAAENRRLREQPLHDHLEQEIDALHRALEDQVHGEAQRLQGGKLAALAEFSAGAGHEINNPLAVISGQAQYLLSHERDWFHEDAEDAPRKALEAIVTQTRRIHGILRELMQFAKPAPPCPGWVDLPALLGEIGRQSRGIGGPAACSHRGGSPAGTSAGLRRRRPVAHGAVLSVAKRPGSGADGRLGAAGAAPAGRGRVDRGCR